MTSELLPARVELRRGSGREAALRSQRMLLGVSTIIAAVLLAPLVLLVLQARSAGWHEIDQVLFRERTAMLLRHTITLTVIVVLAASVLGVASAWCTERLQLPGRKAWTAALVIPVAIPDFVVGFAWHSFAPRAQPLLMASLVMTLGTYPLVYLPVAAALRRTDPALEDAAHSLGIGRIATFFRVTVPLLRTAIAGGALLVVLTVLSEYGAFEILRYQTFTTEIFTEFQFEPQAAGVLCVPLVALGIIALTVDGVIPRRGVATIRQYAAGSVRTGVVARMAVMLCLAAVVGLGVGVPIATLIYWMQASQHTTLPATATLATATWTTVRYSALGALLAVVLALPVAMMTFRRTTMTRGVVERSTFVAQAVPGVAIALALVYFATHYFFRVYQTSLLLIVAYAILHFPLALACVKASVAQAPPALADLGRSLGRHPVAVFFRVTLPLLAPGLLAGFCLVFLTAVTELTATLVLAPIGVQTLATQFWAFSSEVAYGAAAPYAAVIIVLAAIPGAVLGLWFDRRFDTRAQPA